MSKKTPLDLEEILRQQKDAAAQAAKPRFIPRAERKRQEELQRQEEEDRRRREEEQRAQLDEKWWDADGRPDERRRFDRRSDEPPSSAVVRKPKKDKVIGANGKPKRTAEEIEDSLWRARYLGPEVDQSTFLVKKKRSRPSEKKFNFDWDPEDDTTRVDVLGNGNAHHTYNNSNNNNSRHDRKRNHQEVVTLHPDFNAAAEDRAKKRAKLVEQRDPDQARDILDQFYQGRQRILEKENRTGLGRHWSQKKLEEMKERDWRIFKEDFNISMKGGMLPNPMRNWQESGLPRRILDVLEEVGFDEPFPVQQASIPIALQARDLLGVAVTGSGKTLAFLLPLLVYISDLPPLTDSTRHDGPYALILAPTRELVQQIEKEARVFTRRLGYRVVSIVGGHSLEEQAYALRDGAEIIVATPGRLLDCIERRMIVFSQCCYVIMDEADRMIDLGFEEPVNKILDALPVSNQKPDTEEAENAAMMKRYLGVHNRYRQTMMFTATMPAQVERIAKKYLRRPAMVAIGNAGEAVETVEQRVEFVAGEEKRKKRLREILTSGAWAPPIIVFVNIKKNCDAMAREVKNMGFTTVALHGSKTQEQREAALASLRSGQSQVLVATDLAGRGIDVPDVSLVVNFNMAMSIESYTHRIGRTGRAGKSGVAITFLGNEDADVLYDLRQMLSKSSLSKVPDELRRHEAAQQKPTKRGGAGLRPIEQ